MKRLLLLFLLCSFSCFGQKKEPKKQRNILVLSVDQNVYQCEDCGYQSHSYEQVYIHTCITDRKEYLLWLYQSGNVNKETYKALLEMEENKAKKNK
jgi:hypothetical protein